MKKKNKNYGEIDKETLRRMYVDEDQPVRYLARYIYHVSAETLYKRLKEYGIKKSPDGNRSDYKHIDMDILKELYYDKGYALYDVARFFKCSVGTIINRMKKHNLPRRTSWSWKEY